MQTQGCTCERAEMGIWKCWKGDRQGSLANKAELQPSRNSFIHLATKKKKKKIECSQGTAFHLPGKKKKKKIESKAQFTGYF